MLLRFTARNYKSFADEMNFSLVAASKQNDLKYSLFQSRVGGQNVKVQCSSVVYGANASGKSNIISAMDTFKAILLRGHIKNAEISGPNVAAARLELIPPAHGHDGGPVVFGIDFVDDGMRFAYRLSLDLGSFLEEGHTRKILSEELCINTKPVFKRSQNIEFGDLKHFQEYLVHGEDLPHMERIANGSLDSQELFLTNGFKVIFSPALVKKMLDWVEEKWIVVYRADAVTAVGRFSTSNGKGIFIEPNIDRSAQLFGVKGSTIGYARTDENDNTPTLCSILNADDKGGKRVLPAEVFESYGTVRFITLLPLVINAFSSGATLVVDEFDASIHPSALMNIINMFHNDSLNKNHAQIIFNTHNPIFLNSNLFRRDEIKFVQRDHDTGHSELYALSDFGTAGKQGVRNSTDYMKYYLNYGYGAIEDVDLSPVFEDILNEGDTKGKEDA